MKQTTICLRTLLAISHAAGNEETRYYLKGVLVECRRDSVTYAATDGHILAAARRDLEGESAEGVETLEGDFIIPIEHCSAFKLAKRDEWPGTAAILKTEDGKRLTIEWVGRAVTFEPADGSFPDWRMVLPREITNEVAQFDVNLISRLLKAKRILANDTNARMLIAHNGGAPALVTLDPEQSAFGVIMPFRGTPQDSVPSWVNAASAQADAEPLAAE